MTVNIDPNLYNYTPGPWHWHDTFGRKDGQGEPRGVGRGITGDEPALGSVTRFSFAVSDDTGFCVAHCCNSLVTMSSERSEANARLMAAAPDLLHACQRALSFVQDGQLTSYGVIPPGSGDPVITRQQAADLIRSALAKAVFPEPTKRVCLR